MDEINYIDGKYYPRKGNYYHVCLVCKEGYFGRENKTHCSDKCRYHKNNKKTKKKKIETRKEFEQIAINCEILKTYYPASKGKVPISNEVILNSQFDMSLISEIGKDQETGKILYYNLDYFYTHDKINKTIIIFKKNDSN